MSFSSFADSEFDVAGAVGNVLVFAVAVVVAVAMARVRDAHL